MSRTTHDAGACLVSDGRCATKRVARWTDADRAAMPSQSSVRLRPAAAQSAWAHGRRPRPSPEAGPTARRPNETRRETGGKTGASTSATDDASVQGMRAPQTLPLALETQTTGNEERRDKNDAVERLKAAEAQSGRGRQCHRGRHRGSRRCRADGRKCRRCLQCGRRRLSRTARRAIEAERLDCLRVRPCVACAHEQRRSSARRTRLDYAHVVPFAGSVSRGTLDAAH